jgi:hypothetical protein
MAAVAAGAARQRQAEVSLRTIRSAFDLVGLIFYGIAGLRDVGDSDKSRTQTVAIESDLLIAGLGPFGLSQL